MRMHHHSAAPSSARIEQKGAATDPRAAPNPAANLTGSFARFVLGFIQMVCAIWAAYLFFASGPTTKADIVITVGFIALALSRWFYRGR